MASEITSGAMQRLLGVKRVALNDLVKRGVVKRGERKDGRLELDDQNGMEAERGMIEDRKLTAKEERKWRAEFKTLGREAVRAQFHHFQPYIKRDLSVRWLREQEALDQRHKQLMRVATGVGVVLAFIGILIALGIIRL